MINDKFPENINLNFKDSEEARLLEKRDGPQEHVEAGPSSLYGRRGDNITFHTQGVGVHGLWQRMWSWVWKDLWSAFAGLLRIFFTR